VEIIWILLFGLVVGAIAKLLMPGDDPGGIIVTALIGVVGSVIGFYVFRAIGIGDENKFDLGGFLGAVLGTMLLLGIYRMVAGRKGGTSHRTNAPLR
jgi:uncharacterized membrane protein YeaQ/YmgE (transglycosylase-associated protein family)